MAAAVKLTEQVLRRMRSAVEDGEETLEAIGKRFGRSRKTVVVLIRQYGWHNPWVARQKHSRGLAGGISARQRLKRTKANGFLLNPAKFIAEKRAAVDAIERNLYGPHLDDVTYLRQRGWIITAERSGFRVGNQVVDGDALAAKAARERRLAGAMV